jgi:hypothetical protein
MLRTMLEAGQLGNCRLARFVEMSSLGRPLISLDDDPADRTEALVLGHIPVPAAGDRVLVASCGESLVILGAVLENFAASAVKATKQQTVSATDELSLQCGKSSITLRKNGRILIKGVDIVSRATRHQRIKGSTVDIN